MQKGFNSDISYRGAVFHVQTEDWGLENPFLVSRVFQQGAVLKTFKTHYSKILGPHPPSEKDQKWQHHIGQALKSQHDQVVEFVISGRITL
ncbi:MAG: hypothetical protein IPK04_04935 [Bdellovibrionales bacterium]|jgi:hypothetical protein|nr:hypothetical protein [Bdellovibrionales bacterium]